jgi:bacteriocin-like protein
VSEIDPKQSAKATSSPDELVKTSKDASIELSDTDLNNVSGGTATQTTITQMQQDVTLNKSKAANKAADATDAYIRG